MTGPPHTGSSRNCWIAADWVCAFPLNAKSMRRVFFSKYFSKGRLILLEGEIQTRSYDDANGAKQWVTEVVVSQAKFTGEAKKDSNSSGMPPVSTAVPPPEEIKQFVEGETKPTDEDYPF